MSTYLTGNNPKAQTVKQTVKSKREYLLDIEANEKVERNVGLEAGGVDAKQLEHLSLPVRVEEDEAVEEGEEEVEDDEDDQVVVDQLQHRTPKTHSSSSSGYSREQYPIHVHCNAQCELPNSFLFVPFLREPSKYYFADFVRKGGTPPLYGLFFPAKKGLRVWGVPPPPVYGFFPENFP